jgi:hypothetical protein
MAEVETRPAPFAGRTRAAWRLLSLPLPTAASGDGEPLIWDKLVRDGGKIDSCRAIFGDESENYEGALKRDYASGAPPTWQQEFVSTSLRRFRRDLRALPPHCRYIGDRARFWTRTRPAVPDGDMLRAKVDFDPHRCREINQIIDAWCSPWR